MICNNCRLTKICKHFSLLSQLSEEFSSQIVRCDDKIEIAGIIETSFSPQQQITQRSIDQIIGNSDKIKELTSASDVKTDDIVNQCYLCENETTIICASCKNHVCEYHSVTSPTSSEVLCENCWETSPPDLLGD